MVKGQVIGGELGKVLIRQKSGSELEIGELLISGDGASRILLQVYDLVYGSQISPQNLELISGMKLEDGTDMTFFDEKIRNYTLALAKPIALISEKHVRMCKQLPGFFSEVRQIEEADLEFMVMPQNPLFIVGLIGAVHQLLGKYGCAKDK